MTEKDFKEFAKLNGLPIAKETMKAGNYLGKKLSSDLRIVAEVEAGKWIPIEDPTVKCIRYLAFANVENIKTGKQLGYLDQTADIKTQLNKYIQKVK